jgi:transposase-like protein
MTPDDLEDLTNVVNQLGALQGQLNVIASLVRRILSSAIAGEAGAAEAAAGDEPAPKAKGKPKRKPYEPAFRREVAAYAQEHGTAAAVKEYGVADYNVRVWLKLYRETAQKAELRGSKLGGVRLRERTERYHALGGTGAYTPAKLAELERQRAEGESRAS